MSADDLRGYMKALLSSIEFLALNGCIHRDIKPSNFLYRPADRNDGYGSAEYMLIDFGLSQSVQAAKEMSKKNIAPLRMLSHEANS